MNICIISASMNTPSNSDTLANAFVEGLKSHDASVETTKLQLKDLTIEQFTLDFYNPDCTQEEDFCAVRDAVTKADGLVIATPVWNFGIPGNLKNLIDRFGSFALDETRSKGTLNGLPFYLIFTGGAPTPAWLGLMKQTSSFLPQALQYFGASYMGHHFEPKCTKGRGKFGLVVHERPESLESVKQQGKKFAGMVEQYVKTGAPPVQHQLKSKIMKWGEKLLKRFG